MKLALTLFASVYGMEGHGREDDTGVHIGGGAFDPGTSDGLALWAIRKCKKKVCAVWPWAKCPMSDISDLGKNGRKTRGPCCHKCWNKCPPYLARHRDADQGVFSNASKRRMLKDEVWKFLQNDISCETSRLKEEFMDRDHVGYDMSDLDGSYNEEGLEGSFVMMEMDVGMGGGAFAQVREPDESCYEKLGWYQCHGHKAAHCCTNSCLNNPNKQTGKCQAKPVGCGCNGKCDYRDRITWAVAESRRLNCDVIERN